MPRVSVVVPTYNRADAVGRAIESVLDQTLEDIELIVVDDGSNDGTTAVVESFDDSRLRYLCHETNRGGSAARNTGIEAAGGKYVAFLDDDDQYRPRKLARQVDCLEQRSDEWIAAYCDYEVVRGGENPFDALPEFVLELWPGTGSPPPPEGGEDLIPHVLARRFPLGGASTLLVERETAMELGGFDADFPRHQDVEFLIRLLKAGKIAYVDEPLVTRHDTARPSISDVEEAKELFWRRFADEITEAEQEGYDITGIHRFDMARFYFTNGQFLRGVKNLSGAKIELHELLRVLFLGVHQRLLAD